MNRYSIIHSCTGGHVAEVGARPTDEKRTSVSRAQSQLAGIGDEVSHHFAACQCKWLRKTEKTWYCAVNSGDDDRYLSGEQLVRQCQ